MQSTQQSEMAGYAQFDLLYAQHKALQALEQNGGKEAQSNRTNSSSVAIGSLFQRDPNGTSPDASAAKISDVAHQVWENMRNDKMDAEGLCRRQEQAFLGSIKESVVILQRLGVPIEPEANPEVLITHLQSKSWIKFEPSDSLRGEQILCALKKS